MTTILWEQTNQCYTRANSVPGGSLKDTCSGRVCGAPKKAHLDSTLKGPGSHVRNTTDAKKQLKQYRQTSGGSHPRIRTESMYTQVSA